MMGAQVSSMNEPFFKSGESVMAMATKAKEKHEYKGKLGDGGDGKARKQERGGHEVTAERGRR